MPAQTETPVKAYAHCVNSRCPGNDQQPVEAVAVETTYSFADTGGDGMFAHPERSMIRLRFADEEDATCPHCGGTRDLSDTPRLQLDDSGYDRMALLDIQPDQAYDPQTADAVAAQLRAEEDAKRDSEIADLRESNAEMRGMLQALLAQGKAPESEPEQGEEG